MAVWVFGFTHLKKMYFKQFLRNKGFWVNRWNTMSWDNTIVVVTIYTSLDPSSVMHKELVAITTQCTEFWNTFFIELYPSIGEITSYLKQFQLSVYLIEMWMNYFILKIILHMQICICIYIYAWEYLRHFYWDNSSRVNVFLGQLYWTFMTYFYELNITYSVMS